MKNFFKAHFAPLMGVIAMVAVIGFSMAACSGEEDNGDVDGAYSVYCTTYGTSYGAPKVLEFTFNVPKELTVDDIIITDGTGSVTKGGIERGLNILYLYITVNTPGDIKVKINKKGIESGTKTVYVY
jgi:hypothetical protein